MTIRSLNTRLRHLTNSSGERRCPACDAILPLDLLRPRPPVFINDLTEVARLQLPSCPHCSVRLRDGKPVYILIGATENE